MPVVSRTVSQLKVVLCAVIATMAAGCGGIDGVELNGGVFDMMGIGGSGGPQAEPKVPPRAGIVLPPQASRLPEPGSGIETASVDSSFPVDPEQRKRAQTAQLQKQQADFCREALRRKQMTNDATPTIGPSGEKCDPSILRLIGKNGVENSLSEETQRGMPR